MQPVEVVPWWQSKTMLTALVMGVVAVLQIAGLIAKVDSGTIDAIVAAVMVAGSIYVAIRRTQPTPAAPITQAQATAVIAQAIEITGSQGDGSAQ